jgi:adenylyltransferase/sulfurtransferase
MRFDEVSLPRDPACPLCSPKATILELQDYPAFCGTTRGGDAEPMAEISASELKRRLDAGEPLEIIDVREPREWAICRIQGARFVPLGSLTDHVHELDPARTYVLQCRSGVRSAKALSLLREAGFRHLLNLRGGILAWAREVDPTMPTY